MNLMYILMVTAQLFSQPKVHKIDTNTIVPQSFNNNDSIRNFIISYYKNQFEKDKSTYPDMRIKMDSSESEITMKELFYADNDYGPIRIIPNASKFMVGKLNNDNTNDVIVSVYSTEGGNASWLDMFVFISKHNNLYLFKVYTSYDLGLCKKTNTKGKFYPAKIVNKILIGETHGYTNKDPGCCPSLNFTTKFKFDNGFKMISQIKSNQL